MPDALAPGARRRLAEARARRSRQRGKRRCHQRPDAAHVNVCRPWLDAELAVVSPRHVVCLAAIAAAALLGRGVRVTQDRGRAAESGSTSSRTAASSSA